MSEVMGNALASGFGRQRFGLDFPIGGTIRLPRVLPARSGGRGFLGFQLASLISFQVFQPFIRFRELAPNDHRIKRHAYDMSPQQIRAVDGLSRLEIGDAAKSGQVRLVASKAAKKDHKVVASYT